MLRRILPTAERTVSPGQQPKVIDKGGAIRERPRFARKFEFWWIGSFASICPASHGGGGVKLLHVTIPPLLGYNARAGVTQGGAPINAGSPAKPHIRRNLRSHHGPAFGTGELQEGGATL
jgi:hypothetical protein